MAIRDSIPPLMLKGDNNKSYTNPPQTGALVLSICYQNVVPKVRVKLTWGHPDQFLSLVRAILVRRMLVLSNVWVRRYCHQVPSGQYLIPNQRNRSSRL